MFDIDWPAGALSLSDLEELSLQPPSTKRQRGIMDFFRPSATLMNSRSMDDVLGYILAKLTLEERLAISRVCKRWRAITRDPSFWRTIDLRGVKLCCLSHRDGNFSRVLRYIALAAPAPAPGSPPPASRLRCLCLELSYSQQFSRVKEIGRHPAAKNVEQLELAVDVRVKAGPEYDVDLTASFFRATQALELGPWADRGTGASLPFPSLARLRVNRLVVDVPVRCPARNASPEPFLSACARVAGLLGGRDRVRVTECVHFDGAGFGGSNDRVHRVDTIGDDTRPLLDGLCALLDVVSGHVLPRSMLSSGSSSIGISINSEWLAWDDPPLWDAVSRLARSTTHLSIEELIIGNAEDVIRFGGALVAPTLVPCSAALFGTDQHTYASSPAAYKHYLHHLARVIEEAPTLVKLRVRSDYTDFEDEGHPRVNPRWVVAAAEGLVTLLLSLRGNASLEELSLEGFYDRRLPFPAPAGGSWMEPGVNSFARAYLALVKANHSLKKVVLGKLAEWCKVPDRYHPRRLPSNAATIFSESSVTDLTLSNVNLRFEDGLFFTYALTHSSHLARLCLSHCGFTDGLAQPLAAALAAPSSLRELIIEDWEPKMTDKGVLYFADVIPKCSLVKLFITLDVVDGLENEEVDEGDAVNVTPKSLLAVLRGLELNITLRHLALSPVTPFKYYSDESSFDENYTAARKAITAARGAIEEELVVNADPEQRAWGSRCLN